MTDPDFTNVIFLGNAASDISGYKRAFLPPFTPGSEDTLTGAGAVGAGDVLIKAWCSDAIGVTTWPEGIWTLKLFASVSNTTDTTQVKVKVYQRTSGGTETLLFTETSAAIKSLTAVDISFTHTLATPTTTAVTDRIIFKLYHLTNSSTSKTTTIYYEGVVNQSRILSPFGIPIAEGDMFKRVYDPTGVGAASGGVGGGSVTQYGAITPGNLAVWEADHTIEDGGAPAVGTIGGSGTLDYIPKFTPDGSTIGNSLIYDNGTNVGIGTAAPAQKLDVYGKIALNGVTVAYRPAAMTETLIIGDGGAGLSHTAGDEGYHNTLVGIGVGADITTGYWNTGVGSNVFNKLTTGRSNEGLGSSALHELTDGYGNTAMGDAALYYLSHGYYNVSIGYGSLFYLTTGYDNVAIGQDAGSYIADGVYDNNTSHDSVYIGNDTRCLANGDTNEIVIGAGAIGCGSNTATLGNDSITDTYLKGAVHATSFAGDGSGLTGIIQDSVASEVTTGTDTAKAVTPRSLSQSNYGKVVVDIALNGSDVLTTSAKAYVRIPVTLNNWNLVAVAAMVKVASTSGTPTFTVKNGAQTMLSTNITIDKGEYDTLTAAVPAVIDTNHDDVVTGAQIEVACSVSGTGATYAVVELTFQLP